MKELKFKSNIYCSGCLSKVKPVLDKEEKIDTWEVDLESSDRILTVKTLDMEIQEVERKLSKVGFEVKNI